MNLQDDAVARLSNYLAGRLFHMGIGDMLPSELKQECDGMARDLVSFVSVVTPDMKKHATYKLGLWNEKSIEAWAQAFLQAR
jgi:hypothetical protein